jgi:hypothetical protein
LKLKPRMPKFQESGKMPSLGDILKESIDQGKTPSLTVISDSMAPLLQRDDIVGLQEIDRSQLNNGHIITFVYPHKPEDIITHRIAGTTQIDGQTKLITWADRTLMFDFPVEMNDVIGQVVWRKRNGRLLLLDRGQGAWLSNKLSKLATRELMRITRLNLYKDELNVETIARSDDLRKKGKSVLAVRIYRRLNSWWAKLLATLVSIIP